MNRQFFVLTAILFMVASLAPLGAAGFVSEPDPVRADDQPNFIIFLADNLGYGDIGPFGSELHDTPNLDRMAAEGTRFTHFYASAGVCTPSRASLMTGSYPRRVNLHVNDRGGGVLWPVSPIGLHPDEITIATMLKDAGYATAAIGKWHLGDQEPFLPTNHGFDYYEGVPYSDDMTRELCQERGRDCPELPLMRNEKVIEAPVDRDFLTQKETGRAIEFIETNQDRPFFLYIAHAMPGSSLEPFASPAFKGKSENGAWGDSIEELDWSAGMILETLKRLGLDENTLIIWTSDNGAPRRDPSIPQGSNEPLGGSGYTTAEGGMRVPMIAWWPGTLPAGVVNDELATTMDLYVTFGKLAGAEIPTDRTIDGKDIRDLLLGRSGATTPHEALYYYRAARLQAVRSGPWKLYLPLEQITRTSEQQEAQLYNVVTDPGETTNVLDRHPEVVKEITQYAQKARAELGDLNHEGSGQRLVGRVINPTPRVPIPWQGPCPQGTLMPQDR